MLDYRIDNARVCDGTGNPWYWGALGIRNGRIVDTTSRAAAEHVIDAGGLVASPGFIDVHTHADRIIDRPTADNMLRQGVTTVISGNCGSSACPVGDFLARVAAARPAINYGTLVGHGTIRRRVMGLAGRPPSRTEAARMERLAARAMREGAFGLSSGLFYVPGAYAQTGELIALATVVAAAGGVYASHIRSAGGKVLEAIAEAGEIGRGAGIGVEISHLKVLHRAGRTTRGRIGEALALIARLREEGVDVTADNHPYPATCTSLSSVAIPPEVSAGGDLAARLRDPRVRRAIANAVRSNIAWIGGPDKIAIIEFTPDPSLAGGTLAAAAAGRDSARTAMDLVAAGGPRCIFHALRPADVSRVICSPQVMIASDGGVVPTTEHLVHPRNYGTFPRVLREYVREKKLLGLEQCVRRMTSLPAHRFQIADRGLLAAGQRADVILFDPEKISDTATFEKPHAYPEGIRLVMVNGEPAWSAESGVVGRHGQALRAGRSPRRPGRTAEKTAPPPTRRNDEENMETRRSRGRRLPADDCRAAPGRRAK